MSIDDWAVWLTWDEAVAMVAAAYGCDKTAAMHKIKRAWQDGQIRTDGATTRLRFFRKHIKRIRPRPAPDVEVVAKKPGPQPKEVDRVVKAMRESTFGIDDSREALAAEFKTSPSTAERARKKLRDERSGLSKLT